MNEYLESKNENLNYNIFQSLLNETTLLPADNINSINAEQNDNNCCSTCCSIL